MLNENTDFIQLTTPKDVNFYLHDLDKAEDSDWDKFPTVESPLN